MLLLLLPVFTCSNVENEIEVCYEETIIELERKDIQPIITEQDLVSALILVESRGNDSAIGDRHLVGNEAVGALQIRPIMVREVNRICKIIGSHQRFTLKDRFDRDKSIHMFMIWREFHHKDSSPEKISRCWNGGGRGHLNPRTEKYWNKVEQQLNNQ